MQQLFHIPQLFHRRTADASEPGSADPRLSEGAAHIDGEIVPMASARISIVDSAVTYSDAVFDVVSVWEGSFFRLEDHLDRFADGCRKLRLSLPYGRDEIREILRDLVRRTQLRDAYVAVIGSRGLATKGVRDPRQFENRFYAYVVPYVWLLRPEDRDQGLHLMIAESVRRIPPTSVDPTIKNFNRSDFVRGMYEVYDRGGQWPILLDHEGNVTEGSGFNVFAAVDGVLLTPAEGVLEGVTRRTAIELAEQAGIPVHEALVPASAFRRATEIFATSTAGGIMPVTRLDGQAVGDGTVGSWTQTLVDSYWSVRREDAHSTPVC